MFSNLKKKVSITLMCLSGMATAIPAPPVMASGVTVYKEGDKYVKMGGRIQLQYHYKNSDSKGSSDSLFFRRFRPYIAGSLHKHWKGKFQWDMGKAKGDNELAVKDAYFQYTGFNHAKITVGNQNFPFSREFLTSSKKQQFIERTFVGDHNYGTPDRNLAANVSGGCLKDQKITYSFSLASASVDPGSNNLDFDTPVNKGTDFNEGWMFGGRIDYHPFGKLKFAQGDLKGKTKATIGLGAFTWNNDGDNNSNSDNGTDTSSGKKPDVDSAAGFEVSAAFRSMGISVDGEYNIFSADTVDGSITKGIYKNGSTTLKNYAFEGGYMVIPNRVEVVAGYQVQDADNYSKKWTRTSFGANYFLEKHDIKLQFTYRIGNNLKGVTDEDENEAFVQVQYVF